MIPSAIGERYRLECEVGRTDAGVVFDGMDRVANRRVAIEVASAIEEPRARLEWERDAMMAQRLEGEHVLHVFDVGTLPNGVPYVVREIATATLASEVEARGAVPVQEAVGWTLEACEAIAEAHALGMSHGDLRLENVHLTPGTDGKIVKVAWTSAAKAEQAAKQDIARDIAALGALLRVLVTGRFDHEQDAAPTLPSTVVHVIARALAQDEEGTFHNVAELARALAPCAPPGHTSARAIAFMLSRAGIVGAAIPIPRERTSVTDEWFGRPLRRSLAPMLDPLPSRRKMTFLAVSLGLVGFVLGGSLFLWQQGRLPRWTGTGETLDEVGSTRLTSAPVETTETAEPAENAEPTAESPAVEGGAATPLPLGD